MFSSCLKVFFTSWGSSEVNTKKAFSNSESEVGKGNSIFNRSAARAWDRLDQRPGWFELKTQSLSSALKISSFHLWIGLNLLVFFFFLLFRKMGTEGLELATLTLLSRLPAAALKYCSVSSISEVCASVDLNKKLISAFDFFCFQSGRKRKRKWEFFVAAAIVAVAIVGIAVVNVAVVGIAVVVVVASLDWNRQKTLERLQRRLISVTGSFTKNRSTLARSQMADSDDLGSNTAKTLFLLTFEKCLIKWANKEASEQHCVG